MMDPIPEDEVYDPEDEYELPSPKAVEDSSVDEPIEDNLPMVNLLNLYLTHFKRIYRLKSTTHFFDGVDLDQPQSTSKLLEQFYDEMKKYQASNEDHRLLIEPDQLESDRAMIEQLSEFHALLVDRKPVVYSGSILSLLAHLAHQPELLEREWKLLPYKRS